MRIFLFLFLLLFYTACYSQEKGKKFTFKQIGWSLELPPDFIVIDSAENIDRMKRGAKAIEETNEINADISGAQTLIGATKNTYNYFNATIETFKNEKGKSWKSSNQVLKDIIYTTFAEKIPNGTIDTLTSKETIDGISFDKFKTTITLNNKVLFNSVLLSKLYKGFDFGISYVYLDDKTREQIELMLKKSTFAK